MKRETQSKPKAVKHTVAKADLAAEDGDLSSDVQLVSAKLVATPAPQIDRQQLIAEAAFHRAQARGFEPGHDIEDWLAAEAEVDARLSSEGVVY
jgi:Protein of unknown function (DUF2934)